MPVINAHMHLNGSVSREYLRQTALKNGCLELFERFEAEPDVWKQFGYIHGIVQSLEDVLAAVDDVVKNSKADLLEIRTTPKPMQEQSIEAYIQTFVKGLQQAQLLYPHKRVRGLLSIDRSRHDLYAARQIIDFAVAEKKRSGLIVGIDLSGNFLAARKLTGSDLFEAITYGLNQDIGLALHVGEVESDEERCDFDMILKTISLYNGIIHGKVRFGHAIYRTQAQDDIIAKLKIPIEICPTCHERLGWAKKQKKHPILRLYRYRSQVIPGDDDSALFETDAKIEQDRLDGMLEVSPEWADLPRDQQDERIYEQRKKYLFS